MSIIGNYIIIIMVDIIIIVIRMSPFFDRHVLLILCNKQSELRILAFNHQLLSAKNNQS